MQNGYELTNAKLLIVEKRPKCDSTNKRRNLFIGLVEKDIRKRGRVWFIAPVLKTDGPKGSLRSNRSASAKFEVTYGRRATGFVVCTTWNAFTGN